MALDEDLGGGEVPLPAKPQRVLSDKMFGSASVVKGVQTSQQKNAVIKMAFSLSQSASGNVKENVVGCQSINQAMGPPAFLVL